MSVKVRLAALAHILLNLACAAAPAMAQARNPFSVGISEGGGSATGIAGWILAQQGWFEHQLSLAVRGVSFGYAALVPLLGLSFAYGVFHAAGPGHGKAVLASYIVANERAFRRGIVLSGLAALLQGLVAIALVGVLAVVVHATAQKMKDAASFVELLSFVGIVCLGLWLTWRKGRAFRVLCRSTPSLAEGWGRTDAGVHRPAMMRAGVGQRGATAMFAQVQIKASHRFVCVDATETAHGGGVCSCHSLDLSTIDSATFSVRDAVLTVVAAGSRPCSGAILVLVFALAKGVFLAGIAAVVAMSFGVAITTAALASLAVLAKGFVGRVLRADTLPGRLAAAGLELVAAIVVLVAGLVLVGGVTSSGA